MSEIVAASDDSYNVSVGQSFAKQPLEMAVARTDLDHRLQSWMVIPRDVAATSPNMGNHEDIISTFQLPIKFRQRIAVIIDVVLVLNLPVTAPMQGAVISQEVDISIAARRRVSRPFVSD